MVNPMPVIECAIGRAKGGDAEGGAAEGRVAKGKA